MMTEQDKRSRKGFKSALTKEINAVNILIAEDKAQEVKDKLKILEERFANFENAHEKYHEALEDEQLIDDSDEYFIDVQNKYITALTTIKGWLRYNGQGKSPSAETLPQKVTPTESRDV